MQPEDIKEVAQLHQLAISNKRRIEALETGQRETRELVVNVARLAQNMETMAKTQDQMLERLDEIERKPGKRLEQIITAIIAALAGAVITAVAAGLLNH
ncbi:MAG: hypothetical protein ACOYJA_12610 [Christensenellales bacterium]|jgi:hypothetical protein